MGRGAVGTGGLPGIFGGAPGLAATGGAGGFGLVATGGGGPGLLPIVLDGRDPIGVVPPEESSPPEEMLFFHGAAEPLEGAIPGKTDTGLAEAFAATDLRAAAEGVGFPGAAAAGAEGAAGDAGGGRRAAGGGGGGGAATLGLGGTNSR